MCVRLCVLVWLSCSCSRREALPPGGPAPRSPTPALLPAGPTSSRDSLLCKLSTSRPRLSFSSCLSASSCCSSCTCREAVGGSVGLWGKHWAAGHPASPRLPPYLSLQAVEGAGLRLWQLTEERGLGLDLGWGASLAYLLLSGPPSQPQMSSGLFCARPPLGPLIRLFIHSLTYSNIHPSSKYL